jgi:hypothetical protein
MLPKEMAKLGEGEDWCPMTLATDRCSVMVEGNPVESPGILLTPTTLVGMS